MSGLMVSLTVVVAAILAVLVLVFSDQPATEQVRRLRGGRAPASPRPQMSGAVVSAHAAAPVARRGPPPAMVLQRQLALPATRPRTPPPVSAPAPRPQQLPLIETTATAAVATPVEPDDVDMDDVDVEDVDMEDVDMEGVGTGDLTVADDRTFLTRARSSVALVALLALVGAVVALLIGAALFLAELAIQNTVG